MNEERWDESCWYLVRTHPKQEARAEENLRSWQVETFLPRFKEQRLNKFTEEAVFTVKPLFPSYLFAKFKLRDLYHKVRYTRGVRELVSFTDYPSIIDEEVVRIIKLRIGKEGLVMIGDDLQIGDRVVVKGGPLKNLCGVFERELKDTDRVMILLETVNFQAHVEVRRDLLQKSDTSVTVH
jgi:transcriptional antiterminator RfaH